MSSLQEILTKLGPEGIALLNKYKQSKQVQVSFGVYNTEQGLEKVKRYKEILSSQEELKANPFVKEWLSLIMEEHILFCTSWEVRKFLNTGKETFMENDEWRNPEDENKTTCICHQTGEKVKG